MVSVFTIVILDGSLNFDTNEILSASGIPPLSSSKNASKISGIGHPASRHRLWRRLRLVQSLVQSSSRPTLSLERKPLKPSNKMELGSQDKVSPKIFARS